MKTRWFFFGAFALGLVALGLGYCYTSGRLEFLTLDNHAKIDLNGAPVQGHFLEGHRHTTALVTISEAGKEQTYQLFFEGDTDRTGDMGSVSDCGTWVAPACLCCLKRATIRPASIFFDQGLGDGPYLTKEIPWNFFCLTNRRSEFTVKPLRLTRSWSDMFVAGRENQKKGKRACRFRCLSFDA